jgi:hypothetical protein
MSPALSFLLPLATMAVAPETMTTPDRDSGRFAEVLVSSYVCDHLGFSVDYAGLADWGEAVRGRIVSAGASPEEALVRMRRDIRSERDRFHRLHGQAIWDAAGTWVGVEFGSDAQYRFQQSFSDRCRDLAASRDSGAFFTAPEVRLSGAEFSRKTRALAIKARAGL